MLKIRLEVKIVFCISFLFTFFMFRGPKTISKSLLILFNFPESWQSKSPMSDQPTNFIFEFYGEKNLFLSCQYIFYSCLECVKILLYTSFITENKVLHRIHKVDISHINSSVQASFLKKVHFASLYFSQSSNILVGCCQWSN